MLTASATSPWPSTSNPAAMPTSYSPECATIAMAANESIRNNNPIREAIVVNRTSTYGFRLSRWLLNSLVFCVSLPGCLTEEENVRGFGYGGGRGGRKRRQLYEWWDHKISSRFLLPPFLGTWGLERILDILGRVCFCLINCPLLLFWLFNDMILELVNVIKCNFKFLKEELYRPTSIKLIYFVTFVYKITYVF